MAGHNKRLRGWILEALEEADYPLSSRALCDRIIEMRTKARKYKGSSERAGYLPNISLMRVAMVAKTMNGKEIDKVPNRTTGQGILWRVKGRDYSNMGATEKHESQEE